MKKAAKKVFKGVKKVVKKVWKPALIIGATLLTAGMAAPGFAGFTMSGGLGGFLGSVGSTIASGAGALLGTVGLSSAPGLLSPGAFGGLIGGAAGTATTGGMTLSGMLSGQAGINAAGTALASQAGGFGAALGATGAGALGSSALSGLGASAATSGGGILNALGGVLKSATSGPLGKMMLFNGISQGISGYMASKEADRQRKREDQGFFFGGPRRGGSPEGPGIPDIGSFIPPQQQPPAPGDQQQSQQPEVAQGNPNQNIFQSGQIQPQQQMPALFQPGNLDLIGPDPQAQGIFGVA